VGDDVGSGYSNESPVLEIRLCRSNCLDACACFLSFGRSLSKLVDVFEFYFSYWDRYVSRIVKGVVV
jgi:hypothetical protein